MNLKRYVVFTSLSLFIHGVAFSSIQTLKPSEQKAVTLSLNEQVQSINNSVQFVTVSKPKTIAKPKPKPKPKTATKVEAKVKPTVDTQTKPQPQKLAVPKAVVKQAYIDSEYKEIEKQQKPVKQQTSIDELDPTASKKIEAEADKQPEHQPVTSNDIASNQAEKSLPKLVKQPEFKVKPTAIKYPRLAKRNNLQGEALIEIWLDKSGNQIKQLILNSTGHSLLDKAALKAVSAWQFAAQKLEGQTYSYRLQIPIRFKLD